MSTGIIILAAGNSSRLGQPKQLLGYNGTSLLNRIVYEAVFFAGEAVVVVTGSGRLAIESSIADDSVLTCHNPRWKDGMASSIKTGLKHLLLIYPELRSCIITVCDQPHLDAGVFRELLLKQQQTGKGIVASQYAATAGVPVLFGRPYFNALLHLDGQEGARKLLTKFKGDVAVVPFEKGAVDIDTPEDYNNLINT
jgi:molybdenum cofactor cytidylyltransferase